MKRLFLLAFGLMILSLACQAIQPSPSPTPIPPPSPTETVIPTDQGVESTAEPTATFLPTPEPIVCQDDTCLQACLDRVGSALETQEFSPLSEAYAGTEAQISLVNYKVEGDLLGKATVMWAPSDFKSYQDDTASHARIWNYFTASLPADQRKWISDFIVFTDGPQNTLAFVRRSSNPEKWTLGADILDSSKPIYLTNTLMHEFGHLLTLNTDQLKVTDSYFYSGEQGLKSCPQYAAPDGCSTPEAYINLFYQRFWTKIYTEWFENVEQANGGEFDWEIVTAFYNRYPDQFISEYAASHPQEDIAESFATFVLNPKPKGNTIADQKVKFFYEFPELVALRQYAIQGMCAYTK